MTIQEILTKGTLEQQKALFMFDSSDSNEAVILKFNLWARKTNPKYFSSKDAAFHKEIDEYNLKIYRGQLSYFVDIAFRGAAKTARTKLFIAFCIANDKDHYRKYFKVLAEDDTNSIQIVTDIYNILVRVSDMYPEIFQKSDLKREKTMSSFTTFAGVKILADTVGVAGRGALQDEARPDFIWFEDFENRKTLRSGRITKNIKENMEEARTGLAKGGGCVYTCNYISELGNVHPLVTEKLSPLKKVLIVPILTPEGSPAWDRYTLEEINQMKVDDEDFEGERMCKPNATKDILFDREKLEAMVSKLPIREIGGFRIYKEYDPSHRYAGGHDVAGGVALDSSTSVFMDFDVIPAQVVGSYDNNLIKPDAFGDAIQKQADHFGACLVAPEKNNYGHATIGRLKQIYDNIYTTEVSEAKIDLGVDPKEYGWHTNQLTKPKMFLDLAKAVEDGLVSFNDPKLIAEAMKYSRNDLIETVKDPRETTRHFDLLTAAAIVWQMRLHATVTTKADDYIFEEEKPLYPDIGI